MKELVILSKKGNPITSSMKVAEIFEKRHSDVIRAIENIVSQITDSEQKRNFALTYETVSLPNNGSRQTKIYAMTRDGFSLVAMGFTGEKALNWKLKYIDAFNTMEQQVKSVINLPNFNNPVEAARAWADTEEKRQLAEAKVKALEPKASYADRVLEHDNQMVDVGQAAKLLKLPFGRNSFFTRLREDGIFFKNRNEPKQEFIERGYFDVRKTDIPRKNHPGFTVLKTLVTSKGLFWLSKKYGGQYEVNIPTLQLQ